MLRPDPRELAVRQLERDRTATARFPDLLTRKLVRMSASPLSYLRGTAPLFYALLSEYAELRDGPDGEGWLCGDAHLENFGVFRTESREKKISGRDANAEQEPIVFDVNDFDEAIIGPFRFDVLRLVTSLILGGRELGADGKASLALSAGLLRSYVATSCDGAPMPPVPAPVRRLLEKVDRRSHRDLLDGRTEVVNGVRKFVLGERYAALPPDLARGAREAFEKYATKLGVAGVPKERLEVLDVAFRIAGTGSLGTLRVAVLTRGKGALDSAWIFDMKAEGTPAAAALVRAPPGSPAERTLAGVRACLACPPRMVETTELGELSMFVRRLTPQEDRLELSRLRGEDLEPLAAYLGALLGRAHRRGATKAPSRPWSDEEQGALVDGAIALVGIHEASYLAMCKA